MIYHVSRNYHLFYPADYFVAMRRNNLAPVQHACGNRSHLFGTSGIDRIFILQLKSSGRDFGSVLATSRLPGHCYRKLARLLTI